MKVLIVGAGAVGQVYGAHLSQGGAEVGVYVRPARHAEAQAGYPMHQLRLMRRPRSFRWLPAAVHTDAASVAAAGYDVLWLCVPGDKLRGDWLQPLLDSAPDATVVCQAPGPDDVEAVAQLARRERVVEGGIEMAAYGVELSGDGLGEGMRYFLMPVAQPLSGDPKRVQPLVQALRRGGASSRRVKDAGEDHRRLAAFFLPLMAALELSRWSFGQLAASEQLPVACAAGRQALAIRAHDDGPRTWWALLLRPALVRVVLPLVKMFAPFPSEAFFGYHFNKVGQQTRMVLDDYVAAGKAAQLPVDALEDLHRRVDAAHVAP